VIEEVAGVVKDLIKAGTVRQFGISEAAAGTIRLQRPAAHARKVGDHWQPKERRGPSDSRPMVMPKPQP
jgi:aryl-alcohol dehydrogenase-like predicted oxidoreductase